MQVHTIPFLSLNFQRRLGQDANTVAYIVPVSTGLCNLDKVLLTWDHVSPLKQKDRNSSLNVLI